MTRLCTLAATVAIIILPYDVAVWFWTGFAALRGAMITPTLPEYRLPRLGPALREAGAVLRMAFRNEGMTR